MSLLRCRPLCGAAGVFAAVCVGLSMVSMAQASGGPCEAPVEARILHLRSALNGKEVECDLPALTRLPTREIVTTLPEALGMPGKQRWQGVSLRLLAEQMGGDSGQVLQLVALNDYTVTVPWSDLVQYDPIVAYRRNGHTMRVRDKGPLVLIYPFGSHPALDNQQYTNRTIWQIHAITLK